MKKKKPEAPIAPSPFAEKPICKDTKLSARDIALMLTFFIYSILFCGLVLNLIAKAL